MLPYQRPKAHTPATPHSSRIDSGSFKMNTPLTPGQSTLASIIERKKATLPPKPDAAVLAAAAKKAKKHVFFSTPTPPMRYSPIMAQERAPYQFGSCSATKMLSGESHLPPPPYTPVGLAANMPYPGPYPRPFDYACTPACTVTKHVHTPPQFGVPPPPASTSSVTTIFPSVIAASEALRINLGLENKTVDVAYNASYQAGPPINMSLQQRSPSVPGIPLPPVQVQFPAGYHGTSPKKAALMQTVQQKLMSSLDPQPGQTQPLGSMSPNLPPVYVETPRIETPVNRVAC